MSFSNITNIYELLDQDGEEGVARLPPKKEVAAPKPAAPAKTAASPAVKSAQQSSYKSQSPKGERRNDQRQDRPRPPRQDRPRPQQQDQQGETERQPVESARRDRPVDRNNAQDKGASRNDEYRRNVAAGGFSGNKRAFDRKSQNNRGDGQGRENKRGGRGKNNWGPDDGSDVVNQAIKDVAKQTGDNIVQGEGVADNKGADAVAEKLEETPKEETEEEKKEREKREKEEKQVSWSDYQKQLAEKKAQQAVPNASAAQRKANEGVDEKTAKKWSSYEQVKRDDVSAKTDKAEEKKAADDKAAKKKTVRLDELFNIKETPKPVFTEDRDRRDGKRGGRQDNKNKGSGNKGKSSGQPAAAQTQQGPEVTFDPNSFPVLQ